MPRRKPVVSGKPITARDIDRRFLELEKFSAQTWSNLAIVDRVRQLRGDFRLLMKMDAAPEKRLVVEDDTRWG